ncbi:MAG TPA: histidine kinase [Cyclobacteriaceae bacterium]|nr:histidine kinase [Cyclobacteriaceae bacterium]
MKNRSIPYVIIFVGSLVTAFIRFFVIEGWSLWWHILFLFIQIVGFVLIWEVIKALNHFFDKRIPFSEGSRRRLIIQQVCSVVLAFPIFVLFYQVVTVTLRPSFITPQFIAIGSVLAFIVIFLMNFVLYNEYVSEQWKQSVEDKAKLQVEAAELQKEKSLMQYHHLKNQVNPHFLFNAFTSLDGLIQTNQTLASEYVRHLSKVYRYVLEHKENEVVSVATEIAFIQHYISLLNIRFAEAIHVEMRVSSQAKEKGIVMVTLQMLIDNAIKHNSVHLKTPLTIRVWDENGSLFVQNNKQLRKQIDHSTKHGLKQLTQLYSYLTDAKVVVADEEKLFAVQIPLL